MLIEDDDDDDDETFASHKMESSKLRDTHGSSKQWESPSAKKAMHRESSAPKDT